MESGLHASGRIPKSVRNLPKLFGTVDVRVQRRWANLATAWIDNTGDNIGMQNYMHKDAFSTLDMPFFFKAKTWSMMGIVLYTDFVT